MVLRIDLETIVHRRLVPQPALDIILCHLVKRRIPAQQKGLPLPRYHFVVGRLINNSRKETRIILTSPHGTALSRLKSQYAKKPKNPV